MVAGNATAATSQPADNQPQYTLTAEQRQQVEQSWRKALLSHAEKISVAFDRALPDKYENFAQFRMNDWQPAFNRDWERANKGFASFADRNTVEYKELRDLSNAFFHLDAASLEMLRYLKDGDKENFKKMRFQIGRVEELMTVLPDHKSVEQKSLQRGADKVSRIEHEVYTGIEKLAEDVTSQFEQSLPSGFQTFDEYRTRTWQPAFSKLIDLFDSSASEFDDWETNPAYQTLKNYYEGLFALDSAVNFMRSYLEHGNKTDLETVRERFGRVQKLVFPTIEN